MEEIITQRMSRCAICGEPFIDGAVTALVSLKASSGGGAALAAHRGCVLGVLHPTARATLAEGSSDDAQSSPPSPI